MHRASLSSYLSQVNMIYQHIFDHNEEDFVSVCQVGPQRQQLFVDNCEVVMRECVVFLPISRVVKNLTRTTFVILVSRDNEEHKNITDNESLLHLDCYYHLP